MCIDVTAIRFLSNRIVNRTADYPNNLKIIATFYAAIALQASSWRERLYVGFMRGCYCVRP